MLPTSNLALAEEHIRTRAYLLWEAEGGAHGRDDHYWREAIAQLQAESIQPSLDVSSEPDVAVVAKDQKTSKTGKSVAGKAAKNTAELAGNGKAKASKKSSENAGTKARDRVANKAAGAVDEPKSAAKKPKTVKKVSEVGEGNAASPAPARPKKPRKTASSESKVLAQRSAE
ncbi:hypothetical protein AWB80_04069 [Caballeronia pedi]|uniref:DUF2934 domain-containing protein n=1 Tax=Caballeronia pedi TaxID=1777141 RepID=A0A158BT45_9BURK|nr:DUF2934 domain-containing protein [Caballeronia pedi]SAK73243.1 hypothetical protein AWB80_04069 [Caballeronia pedi]